MRITVELVNIDVGSVGGDLMADLSVAYAKDIASSLEIDDDTLKDLYGNPSSTTVKAATVAATSGLRVSAFTTVPAGSSARSMATSLYTDAFRSMIVKSTLDVLGDHGKQNLVTWHLDAPMVAIKPEQFVPVQPETTTSTETQTSTSTLAITTTSTTVQHDVDQQTTAQGFLTVATTDSPGGGHTDGTKVRSGALQLRCGRLAMFAGLLIALVGV